MDFKNISLLVIAGGKSSRLGQDKRFLEVGGKKLLESILQKATEKNFADKFLCVEKEILPINILSWKYEAKIVTDKFKNVGAVSGLASGLSKIKTDWALAVSADMPFFDFENLQSIEKIPRARAIIPVVEGKKQFLSAFYHKATAENFSSAITNTDEQLQISDVIKKITHKFVEISADEKIFFSIDTHADLKLAQGRIENLSRKVPVISVISPETETDFIEKLVANLSAENIKVGVIKNDAPNFDFENDDCMKFQNAGAKNVAVISPQGWSMTRKTVGRENFLNVAEKFDDVDLILTDSRRLSIKPALSICGSQDEVDKNVVAIFSSEPKISNEVFQFDLNDIETAVKLCKFLM